MYSFLAGIATYCLHVCIAKHLVSTFKTNPYLGSLSSFKVNFFYIGILIMENLALSFYILNFGIGQYRILSYIIEFCLIYAGISRQGM